MLLCYCHLTRTACGRLPGLPGRVTSLTAAVCAGSRAASFVCVCAPRASYWLPLINQHTSPQTEQPTSQPTSPQTAQHSMGDFRPGSGCPASVKLFGHVLQKGFEAGGLIGGFAVVPATAAYTTYIKKEKVDVLELAQNAAFATIAGVGLSGEKRRLSWLDPVTLEPFGMPAFQPFKHRQLLVSASDTSGLLYRVQCAVGRQRMA